MSLSDTIPKPHRDRSCEEAKGIDDSSDDESDRYEDDSNDSDDNDSQESNRDVLDDDEEEGVGKRRNHQKLRNKKSGRQKRSSHNMGDGRERGVRGFRCQEHTTRLNDLVSQLQPSSADHPLFFFASGNA